MVCATCAAQRRRAHVARCGAARATRLKGYAARRAPRLGSLPCTASTTRPSGWPRRSSTTRAAGMRPRPGAARRTAAATTSCTPAVGETITERRPRRRAGAGAVRRRAVQGVHLGRPPAVPVVHPGRADRGGEPVRPRGRRVVDLRRLVARGRRRGLRREPGAALARRPGRLPGRRPAGCSCRAARWATCRRWWRPGTTRRSGGPRAARRPARWVVACSAEAHSSIAHAARVMDIDVLAVPVDERGRLDRRRRCEASRSPTHGSGATSSPSSPPAAPRTSASSTTSPGSPTSPRARGLWLHVDGAYGTGGARRAVRPPDVRRHRARRLVHRRPAQVAVRAVRRVRAALPRPGARARRRTPSTAGYLDVLNADADEWNPSDYAYHLTRRARGLPFWFSLADARHPGVRGRDRGDARRGPRRRPTRSGRGPTSSCCASRTCRWWCSAGSAGRRSSTTTGRTG